MNEKEKKIEANKIKILYLDKNITNEEILEIISEKNMLLI